MANLLKDLEKVDRKVKEKGKNMTKVEKHRKARKTSVLNATSLDNDKQHDSLLQNNLVSFNETISLGLNHTLSNTTKTVFDPPDPMMVASRMFRSDGKIVKPNPNATYPTTIGLILLLHIVFVYQWNKRKSRRAVLTSYHSLVSRRKFHSAISALVSHPPADASFLSREGLVSLAIEMGDSTENNTRLNRLRNKCKSLVEALHPLTYGHLSGLPLLTYNSHLLWSCRSLEALCESSWYYARFLIALALVAYLLELRLTFNLLQTSRELIGLSLNPRATTANINNSHRIVRHRTMGTPTMLVAAVLVVYHSCFPFVSLPILPFLPVSRRMDVLLSYFMIFTLLTALSWKSHAVTSVVCGMCSGLLWVFGFTKFLGEQYWGGCMIAWIVVASLLSLRVSTRSRWLSPWIDYVAWDERGRIQSDEPNMDDDTEQDDEDEAPPENDDVESRPLLTRRSDSSGLRGRVPMMDMDDDIEMPARPSPSRGLQQRRSGLDAAGSPHTHRYQ